MTQKGSHMTPYDYDRDGGWPPTDDPIGPGRALALVLIVLPLLIGSGVLAYAGGQRAHLGLIAAGFTVGILGAAGLLALWHRGETLR